ncbi:MAG: type III-A CRISPR-associated protein Csm2 [Peptococcales bacterium]|jgi:CRISPR-associated protein Csm2
MKGKLIKVNKDKNFGFIKGLDQKEYFLNPSGLINGIDFSQLSEGQNVEFEIKKQQGDRKDLAVNCMLLEDELISFFKENTLNLNTMKDYDLFCDNSCEYANRLKKAKVTTSMIRKVYTKVLNASSIMEIKTLRPQFAYTAGRNDNLTLKDFMDLLDYLVKKMDCNNEQEMVNFKQFMEAIVAYRKYVGEDK